MSGRKSFREKMMDGPKEDKRPPLKKTKPVVFQIHHPPEPVDKYQSPKPKPKKKSFDYLMHKSELINWVKTLKESDFSGQIATIRRIKRNSSSNWTLTQAVELFLIFLKKEGYEL